MSSFSPDGECEKCCFDSAFRLLFDRKYSGENAIDSIRGPFAFARLAASFGGGVDVGMPAIAWVAWRSWQELFPTLLRGVKVASINSVREAYERCNEVAVVHYCVASDLTRDPIDVGAVHCVLELGSPGKSLCFDRLTDEWLDCSALWGLSGFKVVLRSRS